MTDPNDPFDSDGFPEVVPAGPASTQLPAEPEEEVVYDTGSDAWWRAQAAAQRAAAEQETPPAPEPPTPTYVEPPAPQYVEPPALVEPTVLLPVVPPAAETPAEPPTAPSPLDEAWDPGILRAAAAPSPEPGPDREPEPEPGPDQEPEALPIWAPTPAEAAVDPDPGASYAEEVTRERPEPPSTPVGPLQAAAGAGIAVLGVVLAVGALYVFNQHDDTGSPAVVLPTVTTRPTVTSQPSATSGPTAAPTAAPTKAPSRQPTATSLPTAAPAVAAPLVPVSVLNNSKIKGLAKQAAADFRAGGWPTATEGNYSGGTIATTTVYYADGQKASAERFAKQFGIPRVAPRFPGLPTSGMTVIVTRDYR